MSLVSCVTNANPSLSLLGGGGGGSSNMYPMVSSIGAAPTLTGSSTITQTYTGTGTSSNLTDTITFQANHRYNFTVNYQVTNSGTFNGTEVVTMGTSLAQFADRYFSPSGNLTGANTIDGAVLCGKLDYVPITTISQPIYVGFISVGNSNPVTSVLSPGLGGGYRMTLTDFGPIS